jgi:carnitine-CoA ligase
VGAGAVSEPAGLRPGTGHDFGPRYLRFPLEQRTMLHVLRAQAQERADHPWLIFDSTDALTYAQAWSLANRVAGALDSSVGAGAHVGLYLRNQREFMPVFYGAMLNRGVSVPLNADSRGPLLEDVIDQADVAVIVARPDLVDRLDKLASLHRCRLVVVCADDADEVPSEVCGVPAVAFTDWLADHDDTPPEELPGHHETCLLQFTSGTTGRAKGAIYPHHFLYLYSSTVTDSLDRTPDDVLTTPLPMFHVAALHLMANSAMHAGCTAHLKSRFSASRFWQQVADDGATSGIILGPMAAIVLKATDEVPEHRMEHIWIVPPIAKDEFEQRFGVTITWQGFGMTEIEPMPMRREMLPDVPLDTLGYAARWMEWGVVDEHDRMVEPGEQGELVFRCLAPYGMAAGYYKRPEATVEAYRNFMFHTGDLASYDSDGLLHFHGRRQERIRRRGENISALELEYVVLTHPAVLEAAAYGVPSPLGEEDVKLDVVLGDDMPLEQLHAWLVEQLPKFMVPRYLERWESFPKTASERIQKFKLSEAGFDRPEVIDFEGDR